MISLDPADLGGCAPDDVVEVGIIEADIQLGQHGAQHAGQVGKLPVADVAEAGVMPPRVAVVAKGVAEAKGSITTNCSLVSTTRLSSASSSCIISQKMHSPNSSKCRMAS